MATTAYDYLHDLSHSDIDAEVRRLLGNDLYEDMLTQGNVTVADIIGRLTQKKPLSPPSAHQQDFFTPHLVDGKLASAGPDK